MNENTFNRLARSLMDTRRLSYQDAISQLSGLRLHIVCDSEIRQSEAQQAALLTAVNTGKRAFLGGVSVEMVQDVPTLLPWPAVPSLNTVVAELGGTLKAGEPGGPVLVLGSSDVPFADALRLYCDGWRGAISPIRSGLAGFSPGCDFALGGVIAGALGVAHSFLKFSGLHLRAGDDTVGLSAWRPDLDWLDKTAEGPELALLPKNLWTLGLGHLGQAYLWNLGLLPYETPSDVTVLLQDFDLTVEANWSAGLLTEQFVESQHKTRLCAAWLERRGFTTVITERRYDANTIRTGEEPFLALCGFDNAAARLPLEDSGFDLVLEGALGGSANSFDRIMTHTFPQASKKPRDIWDGFREETATPTPELADAIRDVEDCGILAITLANKAISASFVGALAGALVIGEALRGCHGGVRCEVFNGQVRCLQAKQIALHQCGKYTCELARTGLVSVR